MLESVKQEEKKCCESFKRKNLCLICSFESLWKHEELT